MMEFVVKQLKPFRPKAGKTLKLFFREVLDGYILQVLTLQINEAKT